MTALNLNDALRQANPQLDSTVTIEAATLGLQDAFDFITVSTPNLRALANGSRVIEVVVEIGVPDRVADFVAGSYSSHWEFLRSSFYGSYGLSGSWTLEGFENLVLVAVVQVDLAGDLLVAALNGQGLGVARKLLADLQVLASV